MPVETRLSDARPSCDAAIDNHRRSEPSRSPNPLDKRLRPPLWITAPAIPTHPQQRALAAAHARPRLAATP